MRIAKLRAPGPGPLGQGLSWAFWGFLGLSGAFSSFLRLSRAFSSFLELSRAFSSCLGLSWAFLGLHWPLGSSIEHGGTRPFFHMVDQYFGNDSLEPF